MNGMDPQRTRLPDPALDAFLGDVVGSVDGALDADAGCPDFAAVVALAHEFAPERVTRSQVAEVALYAPVVPLAAQRRRRATRDDVSMAAFVADVRASVDVDVAEAFAVRVFAAQPSAAVTDVVTALDTHRSTPKLWATVLAVAAALVLVGGGTVSAVRLASESADANVEAALLEEEHDPGYKAAHERGSGADERSGPEASRPDPLPAPAIEPVVELVPAAELEPRPVGVSPRKRSRRRKVASRATVPELSLAQLDAAARQAWRAGARGEAKRQFSKVVARGGTSHLAQMAYGDLMTIARQQHARADEARLWREYLKRFERGIFAEDARAGLCRRTAEGAASTCWQRYLEDFPSGTHARAARRVLAASSADGTLGVGAAPASGPGQ